MVDILSKVAPSGVLVKRSLKTVLGGLLRVGWTRIFFKYFGNSFLNFLGIP